MVMPWCYGPLTNSLPSSPIRLNSFFYPYYHPHIAPFSILHPMNRPLDGLPPTAAFSSIGLVTVPPPFRPPLPPLPPLASPHFVSPLLSPSGVRTLSASSHSVTRSPSNLYPAADGFEPSASLSSSPDTSVIVPLSSTIDMGSRIPKPNRTDANANAQLDDSLSKQLGEANAAYQREFPRLGSPKRRDDAKDDAGGIKTDEDDGYSSIQRGATSGSGASTPLDVDVVSPQKCHVTVLSFNVLAQSYLIRHQGELYSEHSPSALRWERRRDLIVNEILSKNPHVVCLQEVEEEHYHGFFAPVLSRLCFVGLFQPRCLDRSKSDGVAVFYRWDRFRMLEQERHPVYLNKGAGVLNYDNVALIVILQPVAGVDVVGRGFQYPVYEPIVVATTHLIFNPRRGDIKLAQLAVIFAELNWISHRRRLNPQAHNDSNDDGDRLPIVFCGDMNFEPFCPLFDFVVDGSVKYAGADVRSLAGRLDAKVKKSAPSSSPRLRYLFDKPSLLPISIGVDERCRKHRPDDTTSNSSVNRYVAPSSLPEPDGYIRHSLDLKSAYHMDYQKRRRDRAGLTPGDADNYAKSEFMTTNHDRSSDSVDFVFFTPRSNFILVETSPIPLVDSLPKIPNENYGSDHYSVAATFALHAQTGFCRL